MSEGRIKVSTFEDLAKMAAELGKASPPEWMLIAPDGMMYKGTADKLAPIIVKDCSFMNQRTDSEVTE